MTDPAKRQFDFWYAVSQTRVVQFPEHGLETFGTSVVNYHLITEHMDQANKVKVREGRIESFKPAILTPDQMRRLLLEGFGQKEASRYAEWLEEHGSDLTLLKYGFAVRKQEHREYEMAEGLAVATDRVQGWLSDRKDPAAALAVGVEDPWEVCLLKLMMDVIQRAAPGHVRQLRQDPQGHRHTVEGLFREASLNPTRVRDLGDRLREFGLFEEYQDRFFALVRSRR